MLKPFLCHPKKFLLKLYATITIIKSSILFLLIKLFSIKRNIGILMYHVKFDSQDDPIY